MLHKIFIEDKNTPLQGKTFSKPVPPTPPEVVRHGGPDGRPPRSNLTTQQKRTTQTHKTKNKQPQKHSLQTQPTHQTYPPQSQNIQ
jgi:hypothetical protein